MITSDRTKGVSIHHIVQLETLIKSAPVDGDNQTIEQEFRRFSLVNQTIQKEYIRFSLANKKLNWPMTFDTPVGPEFENHSIVRRYYC